MNRHLSTEQLSSYLDWEVGLAESGRSRSIFEACAGLQCPSQLDAASGRLADLGGRSGPRRRRTWRYQVKAPGGRGPWARLRTLRSRARDFSRALGRSSPSFRPPRRWALVAAGGRLGPAACRASCRCRAGAGRGRDRHGDVRRRSASRRSACRRRPARWRAASSSGPRRTAGCRRGSEWQHARDPRDAGEPAKGEAMLSRYCGPEALLADGRGSCCATSLETVELRRRAEAASGGPRSGPSSPRRPRRPGALSA